MQRWQNKIRVVRMFLRGWAKNLVGEDMKKKAFLIHQLDILDRKAESCLLSTQELEDKHCLTSQLAKLRRDDELYWL